MGILSAYLGSCTPISQCSNSKRRKKADPCSLLLSYIFTSSGVSSSILLVIVWLYKKESRIGNGVCASLGTGHVRLTGMASSHWKPWGSSCVPLCPGPSEGDHRCSYTSEWEQRSCSEVNPEDGSPVWNIFFHSYPSLGMWYPTCSLGSLWFHTICGVLSDFSDHHIPLVLCGAP